MCRCCGCFFRTCETHGGRCQKSTNDAMHEEDPFLAVRQPQPLFLCVRSFDSSNTIRNCLKKYMKMMEPLLQYVFVHRAVLFCDLQKSMATAQSNNGSIQKRCCCLMPSKRDPDNMHKHSLTRTPSCDDRRHPNSVFGGAIICETLAVASFSAQTEIHPRS